MAIAMTTVGVLVFGFVPVKVMPDIGYPAITVRTEFSGAAPEEVESLETRKLEEELSVLGGLTNLSLDFQSGGFPTSS